MESNTNSIVGKVRSFCNTLGNDGVSYGDDLEQLTYLSVVNVIFYFQPGCSRQTARGSALYNSKQSFF